MKHILDCWNTFNLVDCRFGYGFAFLDRQLILRILYNHLFDKSKVHLNAEVKHVEHSKDGVTVHCTDGRSYSGDVLAGCGEYIYTPNIEVVFLVKY
jgi:2-polyprenyl-6-methoxyphenol hydroxylase-like FAD-dependent oxidoreductase